MNNIRQSEQWNLLFDKLLKIQNTIDNIDILTITGFFTTIEELEKHIKRYFKMFPFKYPLYCSWPNFLSITSNTSNPPVV